MVDFDASIYTSCHCLKQNYFTQATKEERERYERQNLFVRRLERDLKGPSNSNKISHNKQRQ